MEPFIFVVKKEPRRALSPNKIIKQIILEALHYQLHVLLH